MKKKNLIYTLLIIILISLNIPMTVNGSIDGNYFKADFDLYSDGVTKFNQSVYGEKWGYFNGSTSSNGNYQINTYGDIKNFGLYSQSALYGVSNGYIHLYGNFQKIKLNFTMGASNWSANYRQEQIIYFYDENDNIVYYLKLYFYDTGGIDYLYGYNSSDKTEYEIDTTITDRLIEGCELLINYNPSTKAYQFYFYNTEEFTQFYDNFTTPYSFIKKIKMYQKIYIVDKCNDHKLFFNYFGVSSATVKWSWEYGVEDYEYKGYIGHTYDYITSSGYFLGDSFDLTDGYGDLLLEQKIIKDSNYDFYIKRVAFSTFPYPNTEINKLTLMLNNNFLGEYDNLYIEGSRNVYVWDGLNTLVSDNILFEFMISENSKLQLIQSKRDYGEIGITQHRSCRDYEQYWNIPSFFEVLIDPILWLQFAQSPEYEFFDGMYNAPLQSDNNLYLQVWYEKEISGTDYNENWLYKGLDLTNLSLHTNVTENCIESDNYHILLEERYNRNPTDDFNYLIGTGLCLSENTSFENITSLLCKVNNEILGEYDYRYYVDDGYYIYSWDDREIDINGNDVLIEYLFSFNSNDSKLCYLTADNVDGDNNNNARYDNSSNAYNKFNGIYDGSYTINQDLMYNFWYNEEEVEEEEVTERDYYSMINISIFLIVLFLSFITGLVIIVKVNKKKGNLNKDIQTIILLLFIISGVVISFASDIINNVILFLFIIPFILLILKKVWDWFN